MTTGVEKTTMQCDADRTGRSSNSLMRLLAAGFLVGVWGFPICANAYDPIKQSNTTDFYDYQNSLKIEITMEAEDWDDLLWEEPNGLDDEGNEAEDEGQCQSNFTGDRYDDYFVKSISITSENAIHLEASTEANPGQDEDIPNIRITKKSYCGSYNLRGLKDGEPARAPSLKLKFDNLKDSTDFQCADDIENVIGTHKIMLQNSQQDPSLVRQCVGYQLAREAGLPAPRCNLAKVYVYDTDGTTLLFKHTYVNLEQFKRRFVKNPDNGFVVEDTGNMYEFEGNEDFVSWEWIDDNYGEDKNYDEDDFDMSLDEDDRMIARIGYKGWSHDDDYDKDDLRLAIEIIRKIWKGEDDYETEDLDLVVDVDLFIKFWALETILAHWDGYANSQNNTHVYNDTNLEGVDDVDEDDLHFIFIMSGIDQILQGDEDANDDYVYDDWVADGWSRIKYKGIIAALLYDDHNYRGQLWNQIYEYLDTLVSPLEYSTKIEPLIDQLTALANNMRSETGEGLIDSVETNRLKTMFTSMRAGVDKMHVKQFGLKILYPTEEDPVKAGAYDDPGKIWIKLQAKTGEELDEDDFEITIGDETLDNDDDVVESYMVQNQFWMVVNAPEMNESDLDENGRVDLVVTYDEDDDTTQIAEAAIQYGQPGLPVDTVIVGDVSSSMADCGKMEAAISAAKMYVSHADENDKIGVVRFSTTPSVDWDLAYATEENQADARDLIDTWVPTFLTGIGAAIEMGLEQIDVNGVTTNEHELALLSDGRQTAIPYWDSVKSLVGEDVAINTVALGADADGQLMFDIADYTDGIMRFAGLDYCPEESKGMTSSSKYFEFNYLETYGLSNILADVYKDFAENVRMEDRIGDWSGSLNFDWWYDDYYLQLESGLPEVIIALHWDPSGSPLTMNINDVPLESLTEGEITEDATHVQYRLQAPAPGEYKITVKYGPDSDLYDTPYRLMASAKSLTNAMPVPESGQSFSTDDESVPAQLFVGDDTSPIIDADVVAEVTSPSGEVFEITLDDDGTSSDAEPNDGLYGGEFTPEEEGTYSIVFEVSGIDNEGNDFSRRETTEIVVGPASNGSGSGTGDSSICVLGETSVDTRDRTVVTSNVAAGTYLEIGAPATLNGNGFVGGDALIRSYGEVIGWGVVNGDLTLAGELSDQGNYTITGTLTEYGTPSIPVLAMKAVDAGTGGEYLSGVQTLTPGNYGDVGIGGNAEITLNEGVYNFASLSAWNDVIFNVNGVVEINVEGNFVFGDRSTVVGGEALTVYTNASEVRIGTDVIFNGVLIAPNADVTVYSRTVFTGCVGAENVVLDADVSLIQSDYTLFAPTSTSSKNSSCLDGVQNGTETGVDCGGDWCDSCDEICSVGCQGSGEPCNEDKDCASNYCGGNSKCTLAPVIPVCSEATAADLGATGTTTTVQNDGCVMVRDEYPWWWGTRTMMLQTSGAAEYPLWFTWSNPCSGNGGTEMFSTSWQNVHLYQTSDMCATVIDFQGSGSVSIDVIYYGG